MKVCWMRIQAHRPVIPSFLSIGLLSLSSLFDLLSLAHAFKFNLHSEKNVLCILNIFISSILRDQLT